MAFTGCHWSIYQTRLHPEGCFHAFLWLLETPLKACSISDLTVTEPSCSPILSLEIYRDHKRLVGNPLASAFGLQSVSFRRQRATEDQLVICFLFPRVWVLSYSFYLGPGPHAEKSRLGNEQTSGEGTETVLLHPLLTPLIFRGARDISTRP